ncbi:sphingoid long-chain bases kinase 1-like [Canna indica]|uniref:Sphingoid long-chain bases kinase 1-like n=1 Tax=Canna indica TaxID=4628 RepID=A0AAQ3KCI2_9LILI|nr:sphingoid long-chain bases kinase 1-like [Canna indica]
MLKSIPQHANATNPRGLLHQFVRQLSGKKSNIEAMQHASPTVFPDKRGKAKSLKQTLSSGTKENPVRAKAGEHSLDIGDEKSGSLGYEVFSGKLALDKKIRSTYNDEQDGSGTGNSHSIDAKLTSKALIWGSHVLPVEDVISVSYNPCFRHFTIHAYPVRRRLYGLSCFLKPQRFQKDFRFLASSPEEAMKWVQSFADQQCYINCLHHPVMSRKNQVPGVVASEPLYDLPYIKCKSPPRVLVILNPRSGHGRSSKVFHNKVEPIFKLAGFKMEVVKTKYAGHARELTSSVDFSTCPDGIVCVGGDGIVNEVLNGLLNRDNQKEAISVPIGIIPAGSDNSLVWTTLGIRDPISAAMAIIKGGLTATDVFAVEWIQTGAIHFGTTVSYFGFLSDVLELSEKYQKRFGPLRYFVAGFLKFLCLPKYSFELEYLPISKEIANSEEKVLEDKGKICMSDFYSDVMCRSRKEGIPRVSSLSSIDSIMSPSRMPDGDMETTGSTAASSESSDYVRGIDPKLKRLSSGKSNLVAEPDEVLHPQPHLSVNSNWPRTRSKSRTDKTWTSLIATNDSRCSKTATSLYDKEDISSTASDPGPVWESEPRWDTGPKWDAEPNWDPENPIELPGRSNDIELGTKKERVPSLEDKWVVKRGQFLGVLVCNHSCKTVQSLSSQVVAPNAIHDDNSLDLLLVGGSGRLRLLLFLICLQFGRHISLPYVDYVKVKSVKIKPGISTHNGCGIDGELLRVKGQVICSLLPDQCRLIGRPACHRF